MANSFITSLSIPKRAATVAAATAVLLATAGVGTNWLFTKETPTGESATRNIICWKSASGSGLCIRENGSVNASGSYLTNGAGSSGLSFTAAENIYVNQKGDTMTGALTVQAAISGSTVYGKKCPVEYAIQYAGSGTALAVNSGTTLSVPIGYTLSGYSLARFTANVDSAGVTGLTRFALRNSTKGKRQMFTTNPSIDTAETSTRTAATAYVINTSNDDVSGGDNLSFDILQVQTGTAPKGLKVYLEFSCP